MDVASLSAGTSASSFSPVGAQDMSREDFLQLLVAQLRNQDPLSPLESQEFAADLAQFSSLEQLVGVNEHLEESIGTDLVLTQAINNTLAATLLGQNVTTYGNDVYLGGGEGNTLNFALAGKSEKVTITIKDENGIVVRTLEEENLEAGDQQIQWDGKNDSGRQLPDGNYSFEIDAYDESGETVSSQSYSKGLISGIRYEGGQAVLIVNGKPVAFSSVLEVGDASLGG